MDNYNILPIEKVLEEGIEFAGDVCFSGEWGQYVCSAPIEEGGQPITGIVYEKFENGNLEYYTYYKNGIMNGISVHFYESGKIKSVSNMYRGTTHGKTVCWHENGNVMSVADSKYGFDLTYKEWDESGKLIKEKMELSDFEKGMIEKYDEDEKRWTKSKL
ncbi:hypothetical protein NDS46_13270 [Paenibacillus thiaminolyticus]|uniref:toxin-antitoxin system YwqK family antitoxin n=1 Tax=Paenibacillus thiaminolyticus TaxID=49283 RepID=UPI00232BD1E0|nr:hypothetical protein [Paenibacillus thiaminolyticus]WCF10751.1 hypothetical protein NDS46_13270 [Paenibacillus thiaminolyticus]